jgi:hypothetical protein
MSDLKKKFFELNSEYSKCLNEHYDKFFEGQNIDMNNICQEQLDKLKQTGDFYKNMDKEFSNYQKEAAAEKEKK